MFGDLVRDHRHRLGLTQEELAGQTRVSSRTIRDIETGRVSRPQAGTMRRLATAFRLRGAERENFLRAGTGVRAGSHDDPPHRPAPPGQAAIRLPGHDPAFTGRHVQLSQLDAMAAGEDGPPAVIITGPAGIGKTALALHWAGRSAGRFPDGRLHLDLRGVADAGLAPAEVVTAVLDRLRLTVPLFADPPTLTGLYHSALAGRRVLLVLDNAYTAEQVRPLLPRTPGSLLLVTSRNRLTGLVAADDARQLSLDPMTEADSRQLLRQHIGDTRLTGEPDAASEIVRRCAGVPGWLTEVAAGTGSEPDVPLAQVVEDLPDRSGASGYGADEVVDVAGTRSQIYQSVTTKAAELFRLMSLHPGTGLTTEAAASLLAASIADARLLLGELVRVRLLTELDSGQYVLPHLLGALGAELTEIFHAEGARQAAAQRLTPTV
ncbi:helix-turn-helix domain-containing protein [Actinoplanes sp. NPDC004185]